MISRVTSVGSQPVHTGTAARKASSSFSSALKSAASSAKPTGLDAIFKAAAEKYNVPERLLKAVAKAESGFQPNAVSCCGAEGIMQLMPSTASSLGVENAFDPEQNIIGGAKYISQPCVLSAEMKSLQWRHTMPEAAPSVDMAASRHTGKRRIT